MPAAFNLYVVLVLRLCQFISSLSERIIYGLVSLLNSN